MSQLFGNVESPTEHASWLKQSFPLIVAMDVFVTMPTNRLSISQPFRYMESLRRLESEKKNPKFGSQKVSSFVKT